MPKRGLPDDYYTVDGAKTLLHDDEKTLRREYTRLRDIAEKRRKRLEESDYSWTKTSKQEKFKKLKEIDRADLPKAFSEVAKFVKSSQSTLKGQKRAEEKTTSTLNQAVGSEGAVNKGNYKRVIQLLNASRKLKVLYGSDKIVELAQATLGLSDEDFDTILENLEAILPHSDEFSDELTTYMEDEELEDYDSVDIDDFLSRTGWKIDTVEG